MQIAVVKRNYSLKSGGSERYCVNLVRKLKERGHDLTVLGEMPRVKLIPALPFRRVKA